MSVEQDIAEIMRPLLARAQEKAELLAGAFGVEAKTGLAATVRALIAAHGEAAVRAAAEDLMAALAAERGGSDPIP